MTTQSPAFIRTTVTATLFALFSLFSVSGHADSLSDQEVSAFIDSLKAAEQLEPEFE
ncbi:MAG: hypothetical protein H5U30_15080, partial [Marinobacter sp.]|nr:hypothetical protein [Marinobacter sp.]